ncbi:MAG: hypothetical protein ABR976_21885 [Terracidiphilus sp.]|jgi:hypothetical protein
MPSNQTELRTLKSLISQADLILATIPELPENRTAAARESLSAALALADDMLKESKSPAAASLGRKGGSTTSRLHGPEHYRAMAAKRKTHGGGRPRKEAD